jgi:UDP-2-acetamido-3-amino-2,3-dideoxy-glucuronate N-acetyltransferase
MPTPALSVAPPAARLLRLPEFGDERGNLVAAQPGRGLPFQPRRVFLVHEVPSDLTRGEHAHRECDQLLLCVHGRVTIWTDNGVEQQEWLLDHPAKALHVPPMVWAAQHSHSPGAVLMVLASHDYDDADYIRDYADWQSEVRGAGVPAA